MTEAVERIRAARTEQGDYAAIILTRPEIEDVLDPIDAQQQLIRGYVDDKQELEERVADQAQEIERLHSLIAEYRAKGAARTTDQDRADFEAWARKSHANAAYFTPQMDLSRVLPSSFAIWQAATAAERERRKPMTEEDIVKCLVDTRCIGGVRMTHDSGPYEVTTPAMIAINMVRAVESHHGIRSGE